MTLSDDLNTWNKIFEIWHLWPKSNLYDDLEIKFLKFETCYQNHGHLMTLKSNSRKFETYDQNPALWLSNHFLKSETCNRKRSWSKTSFWFFDVKFHSRVKTVSGENETVEYASITVTILLIVHLVNFESFELFS